MMTSISIAKKLKAKGITAFAFADKDDWTHGKLNMPLYVVTIPNWQKFFSDLEQGKVSPRPILTIESLPRKCSS